jgi:glucose/arabinose dehydrogenase
LPSGIALRDGALYVAAVNRVLRYDAIESRLDDPPRPHVITDRLPSDAHHGWKYLAFAPDGYLYVPVGAPCNVCLPPDERYQTILRMDPKTGAWTVFASGVRNSVGFDFHPETGDLWFTDNGRDWLGDDSPPDELNHAPRAGLHFGFPYRHGRDVDDPEFGRRKPPAPPTPPAAEFGAHVAALGMTFYRGGQYPESYRNDIIVAQHGSWNRSRKVGYRLVRVALDGSRVMRVEPFVTGWLNEKTQRAWGRPVDVIDAADGSLLVSDDYADKIYRVSYVGE